MTGTTLWFTGLSGAGKTSIAQAIAAQLKKKGKETVIFDGDVMRQTINSDLGYSEEHRELGVQRIAHCCNLVSRNGVLNIACTIAATKKSRDRAKALVGHNRFVEVHINCPVEECERRDVKGHYAKVRSGEITNFVGISLPYEAPEKPQVRCNTHLEDVETSAARVVSYLEENKLL